MNTLDIVLLVILSIGGIYGYIKGLIGQLTFGVGLIIGLLQAIFTYAVISERIALYTGWNIYLCEIISFIGVIVIISLIFKTLGVVATAILKKLHINIINRIAGAVVSAFFAALLFIGAVKATNTLFPEIEITSKTTQENSMLYKHISLKTSIIIEEVKQEIDEKTK